MPTAVDTTTAIQEKVFESIQVGQQALLNSVRSWAETVEVLSSKLPELVSAEPLKPTQVFETGVGFTEKVLNTQREFATRLLEAALPATRSATAATQSAKVQSPAK